MTDREMLESCFRAFAAVPIAAHARKTLKVMGVVPGAYAGNGSHILCEEMCRRLRAHLDLENAA